MLLHGLSQKSIGYCASILLIVSCEWVRAKRCSSSSRARLASGEMVLACCCACSALNSAIFASRSSSDNCAVAPFRSMPELGKVPVLAAAPVTNAVVGGAVATGLDATTGASAPSTSGCAGAGNGAVSTCPKAAEGTPSSIALPPAHALTNKQIRPTEVENLIRVIISPHTILYLSVS